MVRNDVLKQVIFSNEKFISREINSIVRREGLILPSKLNKVIIIYGVRRSGKSFVLFDLFKRHKDRAVYIDFEDERLRDFEVGDFQKIKEVFLELRPHLLGREIFLFLDEVQNVKGWERFVRRAVEREKIKVFVSGSSSKLMPDEFSTALRGRSWSIELLPFSFREYLKSKNIDIDDEEIVYGDKRPLVKRHFSEYLKWGGFPEVAFSPTEFEKRKLTKEYLQAMFFKDLVERFNISNVQLLDLISEKLFASFSTKVSLNAFYRQYKDKFPFSKDSLFLYYRHLLNSMLVFEVRMFSESVYKQLRNPAKIYLIDTGIARRVSSADKGRLLENVAFLEFRRRGWETFYFDKDGECDFIVKDDKGRFFVYQVTWFLNEGNKEREINGLVKACNALGVRKGIIITNEQEEEINVGKIKIRIIPCWKWLIKGK